MIEHNIWRQTNSDGIKGLRVAVVGYSHHRKLSDPDCNEFSTSVIKNVIAGTQKGDAFFTQVMNCFDGEDRGDFWNRVSFFNFLPDCIGLNSDKYERGTSEQHRLGKLRFQRLIKEERFNKVFVFTKKGWTNCPDTLEEAAGRTCRLLGSEFENTQLGNASWGTYAAGDVLTMACGFRHPQYAHLDVLHSGVQKFLKMPLPSMS